MIPRSSASSEKGREFSDVQGLLIAAEDRQLRVELREKNVQIEEAGEKAEEARPALAKYTAPVYTIPVKGGVGVPDFSRGYSQRMVLTRDTLVRIRFSLDATKPIQSPGRSFSTRIREAHMCTQWTFSSDLIPLRGCRPIREQASICYRVGWNHFDARLTVMNRPIIKADAQKRVRRIRMPPSSTQDQHLLLRANPCVRPAYRTSQGCDGRHFLRAYARLLHPALSTTMTACTRNYSHGPGFRLAY